jgi:phage repressor protein C with HTH and peptisase S24 domain/DNA-binding XRE family transcriptional regulator
LFIRQHRGRLGLTQDRLAAHAGISKPYLSNIETGKVKNPPTDRVLLALEKALELPKEKLTSMAHFARTPSDVRSRHELLEIEVAKLRAVLKELMGGKRRRPLGEEIEKLAARIAQDGGERSIAIGRTIPIINKTSSGYPSRFNDLDNPPVGSDEYIRCVDVHDSQAFAVRVVGDTMEPSYREEDLVVFSPNTPPKDGDDCFVRFAGDGGTTFKRFYRDDESTIRLQPLNSRYPAETYPPERIDGLWPALLRIESVRRD